MLRAMVDIMCKWNGLCLWVRYMVYIYHKELSPSTCAAMCLRFRPNAMARMAPRAPVSRLQPGSIAASRRRFATSSKATCVRSLSKPFINRVKSRFIHNWFHVCGEFLFDFDFGDPVVLWKEIRCALNCPMQLLQHVPYYERTQRERT